MLLQLLQSYIVPSLRFRDHGYCERLAGVRRRNANAEHQLVKDMMRLHLVNRSPVNMTLNVR